MFDQDEAHIYGTTGWECAVPAFNNLSCPYVSGERYIFVYTMNSTTLALPYHQGLLGKDRPDLFDMNGFSIMPALIDTAGQGGGFMYGVYPNPDRDYQNQLKIYYFEPVDSYGFLAPDYISPGCCAEDHSLSIFMRVNRR